MHETTPKISLADDPGTLSDNLYARLREAIIRGAIPAGSKISEPELACQYGVSRAPLREAINRLEGHNLVVRKPHVGARVVSLSLEELLEISCLREALEGMACRQAALNMTSEEVFHLKYLLSEHEKNQDLQSGKAYYQEEGDLDFHYCIAQGSGNKKLAKMLCDDLYHLVRMYRFQFSSSSPRPKHAFNEHHEIVSAIESHDCDLAELLMRDHIKAARKNIEARYQTPMRN